jgi:predicted nucleotidyltransferase component of viral defense system
VEPRLSPLQQRILSEFFRRQKGFFLTGGAALAGYHLGHRGTEDLDLFTRLDVLDEGDRSLRDVAREIGAEIEALHTAPDFRRRLLRRGNEAVVVDLVLDRTPRGREEPELHGDIAVDPPAEILANKLCTLLSRAELRDLVDVLALERRGHDLAKALALATKKDVGMTPAQLAWVLSEIRIGDDAEVPAGYTVDELRTFLDSLQQRLARMAFPGNLR